MRLKRHRHGLAPAAACPRNDLAQHVSMSAMQSVKIAHAHQRRAEIRRNIVEFVEDLHKTMASGQRQPQGELRTVPTSSH